MAAKKKTKKKSSAPKKKTAAPAKKKKKKAAKRAAAPAKKKSPKRKANGAAEKRKVAETILQAVTMTVIADGEFADAEEDLLDRLSAEPLFDQVPDVEKVVKSAVDRCISQGLEKALGWIAGKLPGKDERETAFAACLAAAAADGKITSTEARLLHALKGAFKIPDKRVRTLAGPIAEIFD